MTTTSRSRSGGGSASAQRFAARTRQRRLRRLGRIGIGVLALTTVGALAWLVGWSDTLALRSVRVEGVSGALATEVSDVADAPVGTPLVRVDVGAIEARVGELPAVASVAVHRSWPRTVTIEVTPRVPAAVLSDGSSWWQVDVDGVLFGESEELPEGFPVIEAPANSAGQHTRAAAVAVATGLPADLTALVTVVRAESEAAVQLKLADGALVVWGTPDRAADKAQVLLALIAAQDEPPRRYDVSAPDRPAVKP